jgi:hypothetical protein
MYGHWLTKGKVLGKRIWHRGCPWLSKKNIAAIKHLQGLHNHWDLAPQPKCDGKKHATQQVVHGTRTKCSSSRFLG